MRILLIEPPAGVQMWEYSISSRENLGLEYLTSYLRQFGHKVRVVSCPAQNLSNNDVIKTISDFLPELIGLSFPFSDELKKGLAVLNVIEEYKQNFPVHISAGGHAASASRNVILKHFPMIDSIIRGEGEIPFAALAHALETKTEWKNAEGLSFLGVNGEIQHSKSQKLIDDLDALAFPARDIFEALPSIKRDSIYMSGSRGCFARCTFCDIKSFYKNGGGPGWRGRSPENILKEMLILRNRYGSDLTFSFVDDQFIGPGKKGHNQAIEFANRLLNSGQDFAFEITCRADSIESDLFLRLKKAGLKGVYIGIDSGHQRGLELFRKELLVGDNLRAIEILNDLEIPVDLGFIMFDPLMTLEDLQQNVDFLRWVAQSGVFVNPAAILNSLSLYPDTPIISLLPNASDYNSRLKDFECQSSLFIDRCVSVIRDALKRHWYSFLKSRFQCAEEVLNNVNNSSVSKTESSAATTTLLHTSEFLLDLLEDLIIELQSNDVKKIYDIYELQNLIEEKISKKTENFILNLRGYNQMSSYEALLAY